MMRIIRALIIIGCSALCFLVLKDPQTFIPTDSWSASTAAGEGTDWRVLVDYRFNSYLAWHSDKWIAALSNFLGNESNSNRYPLAGLLVFWSGLAVWLRSISHGTIGACVASSSITVVIGALLIQADTVAWSTLAWAPWLAIAIRGGQRTGELFISILILFFTFRIANSASHLMALAVVGALLLNWASGPTATSSRNRHILNWWCALTVIVSYGAFLVHAVYLPFPDYPAIGRVVPELEGVGITRPLFGADYPLHVINRAVVQETFMTPSLILLGISLTYLLLSYRGHENSRRCAVLAIALAACVVWDCIPKESISQLGPIAASSRMLPNLSLAPLAPVVFVLGLVGMTGALMNPARRWATPTLLAVTTLLVSQQLYPDQKMLTAKASSDRYGPGAGLEDLSPPDWSINNALVPGVEPLDWAAALNSPSHYVARFFGRSTLANQYAFERSAPIPIAKFLKGSWASHGAGSLSRLADGDLSTRFATARGLQGGDEQIVFWFNQPQELLGISLMPGPFYTDFPRGVEVRGALECSDAPEELASNGEIMASFPAWKGPPLRTETRMPYFGRREDVLIPFQKPAKVSCLAIRQIGQDKNYDLSIAEAALILSPDSKE